VPNIQKKTFSGSKHSSLFQEKKKGVVLQRGIKKCLQVISTLAYSAKATESYLTRKYWTRLKSLSGTNTLAYFHKGELRFTL
jgi:hypothetical protein